MSMTTNKQALREEISNPAIGTREHLRKLSLALLDELEAEQRISSTWRKTAESNSEKLEAAERRIAELEAREETLRPVGVMSEKAFQRLEGSESRFIALWPRPGIYLPRKRPEDGVIVYARTAGITTKGE